MKYLTNYVPQGGGMSDGYVAVEENGELKLQKLSFNGTEAIPDGATEAMFEVGLFPTGMDEPAYAGSGGGGGSAMKFYKCGSVDATTQTWTGYELVLTDGVYVVSDTETTGLTFNLGNSYTPEIGAVYSEDAMIKVRGFFNMDTSKPLNLTAVEDNSTVALTAVGSPNVAGLRYSLNKGESWEIYTAGTAITLASKDDCVQFKNTENTLSVDDENYVQFVMTGKISASGNIQSMLNFREDCASFCYRNLFRDCTSLVTAPELPATNLADRCYKSMFYDCTSLVTAPELPATILVPYCYVFMFKGCTSLVNAPELPATNLALYCYQDMFYGCTSLTTAPELPATLLVEGCYQKMFYGCTSLTTAPELPASNVTQYAYSEMFYSCSNLTSIRMLATGMYGLDSAWYTTCTSNWVFGVASSGTFYKSSALPEEYGVDKIPEGWTVVNIDEATA